MSPVTAEQLRSLTTGQVTLGGIRTRTIEVRGSGPALLLLHGFSDQADTWIPVMQELARAGRRAVAVDLPGYGRADPPGPGAALPQLDGFVAAAVSRWTEGGRAPILVGNSLGAVLCLRAAQDPELGLAGIVPISPAGFEHPRWVGLFARYAWVNPLLFRPVVPMSTFRRLMAPAFGYLAGGGQPLVANATRTHASQFRTHADVIRMLAPVPLLLAEVRESAALQRQIDIPTLILWGRHDRLCKVTGARSLGLLIPQGRVEVLADCGHCPQLQRPELVAQHLINFADRIAGDSQLQDPAAG